MKESGLYKKTIVDVIYASTGIKITDERFEQLLMLFGKCAEAKCRERRDEKRVAEMEAAE